MKEKSIYFGRSVDLIKFLFIQISVSELYYKVYLSTCVWIYETRQKLGHLFQIMFKLSNFFVYLILSTYFGCFSQRQMYILWKRNQQKILLFQGKDPKWWQKNHHCYNKQTIQFNERGTRRFSNGRLYYYSYYNTQTLVPSRFSVNSYSAMP